MFKNLTNKDILLAGSIFFGVLLIGGLVSVFLLIPYFTPASTPSSISQTLTAQETQSVFETVVAQTTQLAMGTLTPVIPMTGEGSPTPTLASFPTETGIPPTPTNIPPTATYVPPTPTQTPIPIPCNAGEFVRDVTVRDGSVFRTGERFTKTWRIKNVGACTWNSDYDVVFVSGNALSGPVSASIGRKVYPGETVDISLDLRAPFSPGKYKGYWLLRDSSNRTFGLGSNADAFFWVSIQVKAFESDEIPESIYPFDFTALICEADWRSASGGIALPCDKESKEYDAWAVVLMDPKFETGRIENESTIWLHPDSKGGWIEGKYPSYRVRDGDRFKAWIGCLHGNKNCDLTFKLNYRTDGKTYNIGSWREVYDNKVRKLDIDLSDLAGKNVRFILRVERNNNSVADANGFWFVPGITQRPVAPTPTPTTPPTATPTLEPSPTPTPTPDPTAAITSAKLTLSQALDISPSLFSLEDAQYTEWNSSCLEMANPGEMCSMVITPGFKVILNAESKTYQVHTTTDGLRARWKEISP